MSSDEQQQAMTAERLAEIRKRWSEREHGQLDVSGRYRNADWAGTWNVWIANVAADEGALLAEVERLRAREAALVAEREQAMAIVRAVAHGTTPTRFANYLIFHETGPSGMVTGVELRKQARALLASAGDRSGDDGG